MLTALKEELKRLSEDRHDPFHLKVKKRVGKRATLILEKKLKQIILIMPDLLKRIRIFWELEKSASSRVKKMGSFIFAYLYQPADFLSEEEHGLFGYLDDAYLVALIYERVASESSQATEEDRRLMAIVQKTKRYVKAVIPEEANKIEAMVDGAIHHNAYENFAEAFQSAA